MNCCSVEFTARKHKPTAVHEDKIQRALFKIKLLKCFSRLEEIQLLNFYKV
jgi:hypothetical protein